MTIQRFRRKPKPPDDDDQTVAARYVPGESLDDLLAVARMKDSHAEVAEVQFSVGSVLVARFVDVPDSRPMCTEYETVSPGDFLAFSIPDRFLYDADDANWRQFYEEMPDA